MNTNMHAMFLVYKNNKLLLTERDGSHYEDIQQRGKVNEAVSEKQV